MKGYAGSKNSMGVYAIRWHYSANPLHDPHNADSESAGRAQEWLESQRKSYPDPNDFAREMEINWHVSKGSRVFPQYTPVTHELELKASPRRVIFSGWDFGWHCPVTLASQIDHQGRLLLLKEKVGSKQTTRDFASDVLKIRADWFQLHTPGFEDFCDPAGQQVKSIDSERNERRDVEILAGLGIFPKYEYGWSRKDGRTLIHQLLATRTDGTPSMYVDPVGCPLLSSAFLGRYVYPETQNGKLREEPNDEEHPFGDVMAALRYLVTGLHARLGLTRFKASTLSGVLKPSHTGYGLVRR